MDTPFDLASADIRRSLAETIAWCSGQQLTTHIEEDEDTLRRRLLRKQAQDLQIQVFLAKKSLWNRLFKRDYRTSRKWQRAMRLLREADADSLKEPLTDQLRSLALKPDSVLGDIQGDNERKIVSVSSLIRRRSELLDSRGQGRFQDIGVGEGNGRMLVYMPEENFADGASEAASSGFFDVYDAPPWDVWVAYENRALLAWVPPQLVGLAQAGIDANPVDCIRWLPEG